MGVSKRYWQSRDWANFAAHSRAERTRLDLTQHDVAEMIVKTMRGNAKAENVVRSVNAAEQPTASYSRRPPVVWAMAEAYGWRTGALEHVLDGGLLEEYQPASMPPMTPEAERDLRARFKADPRISSDMEHEVLHVLFDDPMDGRT